MSKGEHTRELILARAAKLFNRQGFFGSSISDIMRETGLEKGGIYNHFASKEQLALEAFDYAYAQLKARWSVALEGKRHAVDRLYGIIAYFQEFITDLTMPGGCPILNTAVESDDAHPLLRERAREAMTTLSDTVERIINRGIERQELRPDIDVAACTTVFIASMEGAIVLSKLYNDPIYAQQAAAHLRWYIDVAMRYDPASTN